MKTRVLRVSLLVAAALCVFDAVITQSPLEGNSTARLPGEVLANGQQMNYLLLLSDEIGSRLTGSPGERRAAREMVALMKSLGLSNVRREPYTIPVSWERGFATAMLVSQGDRKLSVASYTSAPSTDGMLK